jgi:hypothetical protein
MQKKRTDLFPRTKLEDVAGCLKWKGKPKTIAEMKDAIRREVICRHKEGRY